MTVSSASTAEIITGPTLAVVPADITLTIEHIDVLT